jgi:DNA polymerase-1
MLAFRACAAVEQATDWGDGFWTFHSSADEAYLVFEKQLDKLLKAAEADKVVLCFSCPTGRYFRHDIAEDYKSGRTGVKPVAYSGLLDMLREGDDLFVHHGGMEADDVMGILATAGGEDETVIVSGDKDMQQVPGLLLDMLNPEQGVQTVSVEEADRFFYLQALTGDTVDSYPGCPGVGRVSAEKLLDSGRPLVKHEHVLSRGPRKGEVEDRWVPAEEPGSPWEIVVSAYAKAGLGLDYALSQARLARILRHGDVDPETQTPILWRPPNA